MVSWFVGWKPGVGSVMKVTKYDADWPLDVPNDAHSRFYFNSEASNLSYVLSHFQTSGAINKGNYPDGNRGLVTGAISDPWVIRSSTGSTANEYRIYYCIGRVANLDGMIPFAECKFVDASGRARVLYTNKPSGASGYFQSVTNTAVTANVYPEAHQGKFDYQGIDAGFGYSGWAIRPTTQANGAFAYISGDQDFMSAMIWDLPCNNVPIPKPTGTPISGQIMFEASPSRIKMARPGFSIDNASGRQLIMDSDRTPIKVVMMGTTAQIDPGQSLFVPKPTSIDFDLAPSMVCDVICSINGWDFALPPVNLNSGTTGETSQAHYVVEAGGIRFSVSGTHKVAIKYMLYATGRLGQTTGGSAVIRKVEGQYLQIKRPGSSDVAPGYNDILLDTRFAAVTVLAENYVPASSFSSGASVHWRYGSVGHRINFYNQGLFVFPKVIYDFGNFYRNGTHDMQFRTDGSGVPDVLRYSTSTVVRDDHIVMHMTPDGATGGVADSFPRPVGARYFILGAATL